MLCMGQGHKPGLGYLHHNSPDRYNGRDLGTLLMLCAASNGTRLLLLLLLNVVQRPGPTCLCASCQLQRRPLSS